MEFKVTKSFIEQQNLLRCTSGASNSPSNIVNIMNIKIIFAAVVCVSNNNKLWALQKTKIASGILIHSI